MAGRDTAELQQKALQLEMLKGKAQTLKLQLIKLAETRESLMATRDALERLKGLKKGGEALVPIGSGVYVFATLEDTRSVMVNIGGIMGGKGVEESLEFIGRQLANLEEASKGIEGSMTEVSDTLQKLNLSLQLEQLEAKGGE